MLVLSVNTKICNEYDRLVGEISVTNMRLQVLTEHAQQQQY